MTATQLTLAIQNNSCSVYYPGNTIEASVKFYAHQATPVKGIYAKFKGLSHTSWSTGSGDNRRHHSQTEQYFKVEVPLLGPYGHDFLLMSPYLKIIRATTNGNGVMERLRNINFAVSLHNTLVTSLGCSKNNAIGGVEGIFAKFKGLSHTSWTSGSGDNKHSHSQTEQYFKVEVTLLGPCTVSPGHSEYPVRFALPPNIPSSFEGGTGYVRYLIKVKVDRTHGSDYRVQHPFTIIYVLDLNNTPEARMPAQMDDTKTSCCLCCEAGPVYCMIRVDRRGYAPGESIPIHAEVTNRGSGSIRFSTVSLAMVTVFKAGSSTRNTTKEITSMTHGAVASGQSDYWRGELIQVPSTPPSGLQGCSIIDLNYVCRLKADMEGSPMDISFDLPIIIGTIPLLDYYAAPQQPTAPLPSTWAPGSQPGAGGFTDLAAMPNPVTSQPEGYRDAPPSYQECMTTDSARIMRQRSVDHGEDFVDFHPVYPYYPPPNQ